MRGPDLAFCNDQRLPKTSRPQRDYLEVAPELVVEVRSPDDRWPALQAKVPESLAVGVLIVCVLDAVAGPSVIDMPDAAPRQLAGDDVIEFPDCFRASRSMFVNSLSDRAFGNRTTSPVHSRQLAQEVERVIDFHDLHPTDSAAPVAFLEQHQFVVVG